jgi:hypothetical protein
MALSWDRIAELAVATLSAKERPSSIVYLDQRLLQPGSTIRVDDKEVSVPWWAAVAFVDLQPGVNWGHPCRYLIINAENGEIQSYEGQFPPFLVTTPPKLRVAWKGDNVPNWTIVQSEEEDSNEYLK